MLNVSLNKTFPSLYLYWVRHLYVTSFLRHFCKAAVSVKISNLLICFCSFDLSCPILEKIQFYKKRKKRKEEKKEKYSVLFKTLFVSFVANKDTILC